MAVIRRAISVDQLKKKKFIDIPLTGRFLQLIGTPERSGAWFIYGESGHGKTTFLMQLARELTKFGKVAYNTLEEGARKSMKMAVEENHMSQCRRGSFVILDKEPIDELNQRLKMRRSPQIIIIDSVQYTELDKRSYKQLLKDFPDKLFIFNSHAEGKRPTGALAKAIHFDADVKIRVEGFKAITKSRMNRGEVHNEYIIWHVGAAQYWGEL